MAASSRRTNGPCAQVAADAATASPMEETAAPHGKIAVVHAALPTGPVARTSGNARELAGILRLLTCGSVDDGKSTLIGRLLWDASDLYEDQRAVIERSRAASASGQPDFSLLVDGLAAEREQGITIDIAWRYFDTERRRYVVIDSPGHEQYTRNMASGASHADVAIMLVDARTGIKKQTRRHAAILDLMGVRRVVLAVNKMDLVDFREDAFRRIADDFIALTKRFGFTEAIAIPLAAVTGDNVARRSEAMGWYHGPTLLDHLDGLPSRVTEASGAFRMPVQTVLRDGLDFRGLAGTVTAGKLCVGDRVVDVLSGQSSRVLRIATFGRDLEIASAGQAIAVQLEHDLDIARGAVLAGPGKEPVAARAIAGRLVWLSEAPFDPKASYLLRTATDLVPVAGIRIDARLDLETLATPAADGCGMNDIVLARVELGRPAAIDRFGDAPGTGAFMIVDSLTGGSVAGGVVVEAEAASGAREIGSAEGFALTKAMLAGLNGDLPETSVGRAEAERRALEIVRILAAAGIPARFEH